jgi:hypothetical protein
MRNERGRPVTFQEREAQVPHEIRQDPAPEIIALPVSMLKTEHKRPRLQVRRTDE